MGRHQPDDEDDRDLNPLDRALSLPEITQLGDRLDARDARERALEITLARVEHAIYKQMLAEQEEDRPRDPPDDDEDDEDE